jgi:uncharacterized protein
MDGGVYSCDHYVDAAHRIGDVSTAHLGELTELPAQRLFGDGKRDGLPDKCRSCPWLDVCGGGCPKDRYATGDEGEPGLNRLCEGLSRFFAHIEPAARQIMLLSRQGRTPDAIMAELRTYMRTRWAGLGRNDPCPCGSGRKAKNCCWDKRL